MPRDVDRLNPAGWAPGCDLHRTRRQCLLPAGRSRKTVVHAELGEVILDRGIVTIEHADLHIVLSWAAPDTGAAGTLAVLGECVVLAARSGLLET